MFSLFRSTKEEPRGQMIVVVGLLMGVVVFAVGLVIDGGNGLAQRRAAQNASDFASMAGARVVAQHIGGNAAAGTDANVQAAIVNEIAQNGGNPITFSAPDGPRYVSGAGALLGYVGAGTIPGPTCAVDASGCAAGVQLSSNRNWKPFFLGVFGINQWATSATATAKGGYSNGAPLPGTLFPAGISLAFFQSYPACDGPISNVPGNACYPEHLTPGNLNVPGGFGWLKFGCNGYGLGQDPPANVGGCQNNVPFLQGEIGPPSQSYGCCTAVGLSGSLDHIGSLPGNKVSADCSYQITNQLIVTVPIWDKAGGTGSNAWYHIVGYAGFQITGCSGGKNIEGVWRLPFFNGPVSTTPTCPQDVVDCNIPHNLGVQLVR
ncbi:MAG: pilus assembly protein TadG-related protein [Chloroflexota bacterium]